MIAVGVVSALAGMVFGLAVGYVAGRRAGREAGNKEGFAAALRRAIAVGRPNETLRRVLVPRDADLSSG